MHSINNKLCLNEFNNCFVLLKITLKQAMIRIKIIKISSYEFCLFFVAN